MGFSQKFFGFKREWKFFWDSVFDFRKQKTKRSRMRALRPESLPWLSLQRQKLNQRLEELEFEMEEHKDNPANLIKLHDEGQAISEKIDKLSSKISKARSSEQLVAR